MTVPATSFTDDDFKRTIRSALRLEALLALLAATILAIRYGWQTATLLLIGALISASGLWEWLRLMSALMVRMDAGAEARPMTLVLLGFFLRLGLAIVVLYASLKTLNGSVFALAGGLGLGVLCLAFEALRSMK